MKNHPHPSLPRRGGGNNTAASLRFEGKVKGYDTAVFRLFKGKVEGNDIAASRRFRGKLGVNNAGPSRRFEGKGGEIRGRGQYYINHHALGGTG